MRNLFMIFLLPLCGVYCAKPSDFDDDAEDDDFVPFIADKYDRFDWKLCSALDVEEPGNVLASPVSVKMLLFMLYEATTGEAARELERALQLTDSKSASRAKFSALLKTLQQPSEHHNLEIGMRLYVDKTVHPKNWFQRILALFYSTYAQKVQFTKPEESAATINEWTNTITHGHIKQLIDNPESLRGAVLLLVNAIYFQGQWKAPFSEADSYVGTFASSTQPKSVRFMTQTGLFYYSESEELNSKMLRLPYKGKKFSMYIVLPNQPDGLDFLLKNIRPFALQRLKWSLAETSVEVTMPSFRFDFTINFKPILERMGVGSIFKNYFDFHGVSSYKKNSQMVISDILQKASIEVTESGTVAAAATEADVVNKLGIPELDFNASHPFVFFIEDETTGTVIFEGKLLDPEIMSSKLIIRPHDKVPYAYDRETLTPSLPPITLKSGSNEE